MAEVGRARRWGWLSLALLALALPMFLAPGTGEGGAWALAGAIVLHPAVAAGVGALINYRDLDEEARGEARVALVALPAVFVGAVWLWLSY